MGLKRKKHHCRYIQAGCRTPQILIQVIPLKWGIGGGFGTGKLSVIIGPISIVLYYGRAPILEIETHNKMFWPFHKESFGKGERVCSTS